MEHWDKSVPPVETWQAIHTILKPGAFCLSFCSPEYYHKMVPKMEEAGFGVKDMIIWIVTTKMAKHNRLKPAFEPIVVCQKPFTGTLKANFEEYGCGIVNTETTRVPWEKRPPKGWVANGASRRTFGKDGKTTGSSVENGTVDADERGRYPSNIIGYLDEEEYQKYFYAPRVTRKERGEYNDHPTPKPISLMRYLVRTFCPAGGHVIDPFCGSGSTGIAALNEECTFTGIEREDHYCDISRMRIAEAKTDKPAKLFYYE